MPRVFVSRRIAFSLLCLLILYVAGRSFFQPTNDISSDLFFKAGNKCVFAKHCVPPSFLISIKAESKSAPPVACFDSLLLFDEAKLVKGLNIAIINAESHLVEEVHYIDLLETDQKLIDLLSQISTYKVIVAVSYGDVAGRLSIESRQMLGLFGSSTLDDYTPETSLGFIGQWGLSSSLALQTVTKLNLATVQPFSNCVRFPLGRLSNVTRDSSRMNRIDEQVLSKLSAVRGRKHNIHLGSKLLNCGVPTGCEDGQIPMSFYSGRDKDDTPRLCVNGNFVIDRGINGAGRGLNIAIIDTKTKQVVRCGHFDTYEDEGTELVLFLEQLAAGEMIAVVTFDEASLKLSDSAKRIFFELGSSLVENIKFRSSWYFIGQKGIDGFSPFEDLFVASGNDWAQPVDNKICVPTNLNGLKPRKGSQTDQIANPNIPRRHFCSRYDGYEDFCDLSRIDQPIAPRALLIRSRSSNPVFSVPILVVGGLAMNNIRISLESLYKQEGLNTQNVVVSFDSDYPEVADLAALFHVKSLPVKNISSYSDLVLKSISRLMDLFPSASVLIVVEEDVILSPDFLFFFDQLMPYFLSDSVAHSVIAWNINGFFGTSSLPSMVYRLENAFPLGAYMLKRRTYEDQMKGKEKVCCSGIRPEAWNLNGVAYVPDTSRIRIISPNNLDFLEENMIHILAWKRIETGSPYELLENKNRLDEEKYDFDLMNALKKSRKIDADFVLKDMNGGSSCSPVASFNLTVRQPFAVLCEDERVNLSTLLQCFHLYFNPDHSHGFYKGVLRFSVDEHLGHLVTSASPFSIFLQLD